MIVVIITLGLLLGVAFIKYILTKRDFEARIGLDIGEQAMVSFMHSTKIK